jgi:hypothetical protein
VSKQFRLHINYLILSFLFSSWSWGGSELALSMVPRGKILEENGREILVKTAMGTKVTIEFHRNGGFQEASGKNLNQGDDLEPGDGLISLSTAALVIKGHAPEGYWTLEKDQILGWIYDFNLGIVDAKTGKILERKKILKNAQSF